jgi:hypothetical protein
MVFMNYEQANELQELISEKHCPGLLEGDPIASNVGAEKETHTFVKVQSGANSQPELVVLRDWLKAKQSTLEWSLGLNSKATCTANTRIMEDNMFGCEQGFVKASVVET